MTALSDADFALLMAPFEPFERPPRLAVAVSGGGDSMALCLLAAAWAEARGGSVAGLTVDHGLRSDSAAEAAQVGAWLGARGLAHHRLRWDGDKPAGGLQAAARRARYRLLLDWCARHGCLHLALAHHQDDQAETMLMRAARGSGLDGLAAMAPMVEAGPARLLRPLLATPKSALVATLRARGQAWCEDPSNDDLRFDRTRLRRQMPALAAAGLATARLAATAARLGRARAALEQVANRALAGAAMPHPAGFVVLDPARLLAEPAEIGRRLLARVLLAVGGADYAPRAERLDRLYRGLAGDGGGRTLAGCLVLPRRDGVLVCREPAAATERATVPSGGGEMRWDGRFRLRFGAAAAGLTVARLGDGGWRRVAAERPALRRGPLPAPVRPSLPAIYDRGDLLAVPQLGYNRIGAPAQPEWLRWSPAHPLTVVGHCLVCPPTGIISRG